MSGKWRILASLACVVALAAACAGLGGSTSDPPETSDGADDAQTEQAVADLKRMSEFLASHATLRFEADIRYDAIQASGQKIEFGSHRRIALRRPNRARVEVSHWDGAQELLNFDGERLSATLPERHVYASVEYAGTIADAFEHLITEYGMAAPLADLLRPDLPDHVTSRVLSARRLEPVTIAGTPCDHLAFRGPGVDFQLFIRRGDAPVPVRFVIDYHTDPGSPQFRAQLRDWDLGTPLPDSLFHFAPPTGAQRVAFAEFLDLLLGPLHPDEAER